MSLGVLITGGSGRLGSVLKDHFNRPHRPKEFHFDITDPLKMVDYLKANTSIEVVVHCAALTDVVGCEQEPLEAYRVNTIGTYYLTEICKELGIKLVYISTDHVFDGKKGNYTEEDIPNPTGHYARSKLAGEWFVLSEPRNLVIRTSFMNDFPFQKAYIDKFFSAEDVHTIAGWIADAVKEDMCGLVNIAGERKNVYTLARRFNEKVLPMELSDRPTNTHGMAYLKDTSLDITKWRNYDPETC